MNELDILFEFMSRINNNISTIASNHTTVSNSVTALSTQQNTNNGCELVVYHFGRSKFQNP